MRRIIHIIRIMLGNHSIIFIAAAGFVMMVTSPERVIADHVGAHTTPCNEADTVGGGELGISPGPMGPPDSLGWDVGTGQCNGSFTVTRDPSFPSDSGGGIELGLRIEQRSVGQVARTGANDYTVQVGNDTTAGALNRAWWNFQHSIALDGFIGDLDALTFTITTQAGPNLPAASSVDLLAVRPFIDDRNNHATSTFSDLYQTSQNPEFGWFAPTVDTDANPNGKFDYDVEGAWLMTLTAEKDHHTASVTICVHTPNSRCSVPDHFACYDADQKSRLPNGLTVNLSDQFTTEEGVKIRKVKEICTPVDKNGEGIINPAFHLVCYDVKSKEKEKADVRVTNQFTTGEPQKLRVKGKMERLCVPSFKEVVISRDDD